MGILFSINIAEKTRRVIDLMQLVILNDPLVFKISTEAAFLIQNLYQFGM